MGPTPSVPCQSRATGMNESQSSRQIRSWFVQTKFSNRLRKNYGGTREFRWSARLGQARSVWSIWLVWFNQINKTNQTNQINETDQTDQMNKTGWRTVSASFQDYALGTIRVRYLDSRAFQGVLNTTCVLIPTGILVYEGISQSNLWNHGGCRLSDASRDSASPSEINCSSTSHPCSLS